ncbi:MAG: methyltransferase domain-containing protein [Bacteroidia bacterium]
MGSQAIQGQLWGKQPKDWATIQEQTANAGYNHALYFLKVKPSDSVLDIGCGSGLFCNLISETGASITGIDASEAMIVEAKGRHQSIKFLVGEMEELPFLDGVFNIVSGFNSFQYAANITNALKDAKRVLVRGGKLVTMIWGNKEDCEAASFLKAVGSLLPPPPPGAPGPFALSENQLLEKTLEAVGFKIINNTDVISIWDYPSKEIALKGLMSSGPVARAIENSGFDKVLETISASIQPYIKPDGKVAYNNKFRIVISEKV